MPFYGLRPLLAVVFTVLCLSAASGSPSVDEATQLFQRANTLYQNRDFAGAREIYGKIVRMGIESPEVYYNLGNTHARLGDNGYAVLWYERARRFVPRDEDLLANLRRVAPVSNHGNTFILAVPFVKVLDHFSLREWMAVFLSVFVAAGILGAVYFAQGPRAGGGWLRRMFFAAGVATLVLGAFTAMKYREYHALVRVVLVTDMAAVRSGPGEKFSELERFRAGTILTRLPFADDGWIEVALPDGRKGFVESKMVERL